MIGKKEEAPIIEPKDVFIGNPKAPVTLKEFADYETEAALFEIATAELCFAIDEAFGRLSESQKLPPQFEGDRASIEKSSSNINKHR